MDNPALSVYMTTYYHETYVRQAIESVLAQEIDVPYEFIISDDCSKDGTQQILHEYANQYPHIKLNLNDKNVGMTQNMFLAKTLCTGNYVIGISGDDYWIDRHKLQNQYNFLEKNKKYIGVTTQMEIRMDYDTKPYKVTPSRKNAGKEFTLEMFLRGKDFPLNGLLQRNLWRTQSGKNYFAIMPQISTYIDDLTDCILLLKKGSIFILPGTTVAYRVRRKVKDTHNFNVSNQQGIWFARHVELLNGLERHFGTELDLTTRYAMVYAVGLLHAIYYKKLKYFITTARTIPKNKAKIMIRSLKYIPLKILSVLSEKFTWK